MHLFFKQNNNKKALEICPINFKWFYCTFVNYCEFFSSVLLFCDSDYLNKKKEELLNEIFVTPIAEKNSIL